jgi:hypothetical protein
MPGRSVADPRITVRMTLDRRAAESLQLEFRRLARRLGLAVASVRIRKVGRPG